jgi:2-deoxy-D-gluconate 3-dehydrogenase
MKWFDLSEKVALVTGGNGGIGLGMARGLARAGARVMIAGRNEQKNARAVADVSALGTACGSIVADVVREGEARSLVPRTIDRFGRLDILINNAGVPMRKLPQDHTTEDWRLVLDTNLSSAFWTCQTAHPEFRRLGGGKIINVGSHASILGAPYTAAYAASKGGILQLTRSLACAWGPDNIQANAILPGYIETDMAKSARREVPGLEERVLSRTPLGRWGTLDDCEGIAVFLASSASDFITGTALVLDGGYAALG